VSNLLKKPAYQEPLLTYSAYRWIILQVALINGGFPIAQWHRPFFCSILYGQINGLVQIRVTVFASI
jgi:hypothetical protein